jgi:hypothetical protein
MARKPPSQWSPAYARRMESAAARGLTRQQARGHGAAEHISRKAAKGLTPSQSAQVGKFAREQAGRRGADPDIAALRLKAWVRDHGFRRFQNLRDARTRRMGEHRERKTTHYTRDGGGRATLHISTGPGMAALDGDVEAYDLPDMDDDHDDYGWFFYH